MRYSYIYALIDPRNNIIRYIGKSIYPFKRYLNHLCEKKDAPKNRWIKRLKNRNLKPNIKILCKCKIKNVNSFEKKYISIYKKTLYNEREGGDGWNLKRKWKKTPGFENVRLANMKKVKIKNLETKEISFFNSVLECAAFLKVDKVWISNSLRNPKKFKTIKNHLVSYQDKEFIEPVYKFRHKNIKKIDPKTNKILKIYKTLNEVENDGFNKKAVNEVLLKKKSRLTHKGFKWETD